MTQIVKEGVPTMANNIPKPDMNEFFVRNIPLRDALDARARWETLSQDELIALGFGDEPAITSKVLH